jgi:hypothetical protein
MDVPEVPAAERKPKKLSLKFKLLIYIGYDLQALFLSVIYLLQGGSKERTLLTLLGNVIIMNLVFWCGFKLRDRGIPAS